MLRHAQHGAQRLPRKLDATVGGAGRGVRTIPRVWLAVRSGPRGGRAVRRGPRPPPPVLQLRRGARQARAARVGAAGPRGVLTPLQGTTGSRSVEGCSRSCRTVLVAFSMRRATACSSPVFRLRSKRGKLL